MIETTMNKGDYGDVHASFDEIPELASVPLTIEPALNQNTSGQRSSELVLTQRSSTTKRDISSPDVLSNLFEELFDDQPRDNNRRMSPNFVATLHPQDDIPSLVSGSSTPIFRAAESTQDTPLVSQESSTTVLLPNASNNSDDDRLIYVVPSEVNSFANPFGASTTKIGESSQARYVDPVECSCHIDIYTAKNT
ncbi:hypothetical protein Tco_0975042 [Tanacetum coccineum]|uniref:Uncharacterized protein n=1 Tax=Tanacetum coccineum TaxID=301880 RepID=A0ABQ5EDB5_9ASTR